MGCWWKKDTTPVNQWTPDPCTLDEAMVIVHRVAQGFMGNADGKLISRSAAFRAVAIMLDNLAGLPDGS